MEPEPVVVEEIIAAEPEVEPEVEPELEPEPEPEPAVVEEIASEEQELVEQEPVVLDTPIVVDQFSEPATATVAVDETPAEIQEDKQVHPSATLSASTLAAMSDVDLESKIDVTDTDNTNAVFFDPKAWSSRFGSKFYTAKVEVCVCV